MLSFQNLLNPIGKEHYKIIIYQDKLNKLIHDQYVRTNRKLKELKFIITKNRLLIRGVARQPEAKYKALNIGDIFFTVYLSKDEVKQHQVSMNIDKIKVHNPKKKIDLWKTVNRYSHIIRKRILLGLTESGTFKMMVPFKKICFDLNEILKEIPSEVNLLGNIKINNVSLHKKYLSWYIESNIVLRSVIDYLGPDYLVVDKIDQDADAMKLLTDLSYLEDE